MENHPDAKTIWVVVQGYLSQVVLKEIEINPIVNETYDIPI